MIGTDRTRLKHPEPDLHAARHVRNGRQARATVALVLRQDAGLRADGTILDLEAQDAPIFQLELATEKAMRLEDISVGCAGGDDQLHFAAANGDVDGLVAVRVVVERLRLVTCGLADKRFLYVASLHAGVAAQFMPRARVRGL